jgi:hypothetical protein
LARRAFAFWRGYEPVGFLLNGSQERPGGPLFLCLGWHCANQQQIQKRSRGDPLHINLHIY